MLDDIQRIYKQLQNFHTRLSFNVIPYTLIKPMPNWPEDEHPANIIRRIFEPLNIDISKQLVPYRTDVQTVIDKLKEVQQHFIIPELAKNIRDLEHHVRQYPDDMIRPKPDPIPRHKIYEEIVYANGRIEKHLHINGRSYVVRSKPNESENDLATRLSTLLMEDYEHYDDICDFYGYDNKYGNIFDAVTCLCPSSGMMTEYLIQRIVEDETLMIHDDDKPAGIKLPRLKPLKAQVKQHTIYYSDLTSDKTNPY